MKCRDILAAAFLVVTALTIPVSAFACSCTGAPFLSPNEPAEHIVAFRVLSHSELIDGRGHPASMDVEVIKRFRGPSSSSNLTFKSSIGQPCGASVLRYPVGSEWVLAYRESPVDEGLIIGGCQKRLEIKDGLVSGFIRYPECNGSFDDCHRSNQELDSLSTFEEFTLDELNLMQQTYYQGQHAGASACGSAYSSLCIYPKPSYDMMRDELRVPIIEVSNFLAGHWVDVSATFRKVESCEEGGFEMTSLRFAR